MQGRPKGGKNKKYTEEEKLKYVQEIINGRSCWDIEKEEKISHSTTSKWLKKYNEQGIEGLKNDKKKGNPLLKYSSKKHQKEVEELQNENTKLKLENERLKKECRKIYSKS